MKWTRYGIPPEQFQKNYLRIEPESLKTFPIFFILSSVYNFVINFTFIFLQSKIENSFSYWLCQKKAAFWENSKQVQKSFKSLYAKVNFSKSIIFVKTWKISSGDRHKQYIHTYAFRLINLIVFYTGKIID